MFGIHVAILSDDQHRIVKQALADAGTDLESFFHSETDKLIGLVKAKFPALISAIQKGIADLKDDATSGGAKAVKVAEDALEIAPEIVRALPQAKDFLVKLVTSVFADGVAELETAAGKAVATITAGK